MHTMYELGKLKSHDKNNYMATLCGVSKSKFHSLRSRKCALNEKASIIKSLVNSNLDLNPLKRNTFINFP